MRIGLQAYIQGSARAIDFYQKAFGALLGYNVRNDDGTYMHAELYLNGQLLLALSESGSSVGIENVKRYAPSDYPTMNFSVHLDSEGAVRKAYDILIEGGNILLPLGPLPWSTCCANVVDKYGIFWYVSV